MGFWHTGYMEFHEPAGLGDFKFKPIPRQYICLHCNLRCSSGEELRTHRFENHPLRRPVLFLFGRELGTHPVRVTTSVSANDVCFLGCSQAVLNNEHIPIEFLPKQLSLISSDVCSLILKNGVVSAEFTLDFRIASEIDLKGIEDAFEGVALAQRLNTRIIEEFIAATSQYRSAIGYSDGICAYLYGVLAKERTGDSSLSYESYIGKYNKAAEELKTYGRPLAQTICGLVEFHFNHFSDASNTGAGSRIGQAASRYVAWLDCRDPKEQERWQSQDPPSKLERLVADWETEAIIRYVGQPLNVLAQKVDEIESFLKGSIAEYDRLKVRVLLAEIYRAIGNTESALRHAKAMRNLPALEKWSESMIQRSSPGLR